MSRLRDMGQFSSEYVWNRCVQVNEAIISVQKRYNSDAYQLYVPSVTHMPGMTMIERA